MPDPSPQIQRLLDSREWLTFECKRAAGKPGRLLETVSAFANTEGGTIAVGLEDPEKGDGANRIYGLEEVIDYWDQLQRLCRSGITDPDKLGVEFEVIPCQLRDGSDGSVGVVRVSKGSVIHSLVDGGTYFRLPRSNRQLSANEINELSFGRGIISAESRLVEVDFDLLDTPYWRSYSSARKLTRPIAEALYHLGLAKRTAGGELRPTLAAVLLFAEHPSGMDGGKASVRVFHYKGNKVTTDPNTNLVRPPLTVGGPLIQLIREAHALVVRELGERVQHGPLGFEIVQKYPVRVVNEAITNAVIHRDYRLPTDIFVRIFGDRVEVESPGRLPGRVTAANIARAGSVARNPLVVQHLREFPNPPNLDAGEGVPMMVNTMHEAGLFPPQWRSRAALDREAVVVTLLNQNRPSVWEQVCHHLDQHGTIGNAELRLLQETDDTLGTSKLLRTWVNQGLLAVANPDAGNNVRRYMRPALETAEFFSNPDGKEPQ